MCTELGVVNWKNFYMSAISYLGNYICSSAPLDKSLATEIVELNEKVVEGQQQLFLKEKKIEIYKSSSHNINRKLKRKEDRISKLLAVINSLKHEIKAPVKNKHTNSLSSLVRYYKAKCHYLKNKFQTYYECSDCTELDIAINNLKQNY